MSVCLDAVTDMIWRHEENATKKRDILIRDPESIKERALGGSNSLSLNRYLRPPRTCVYFG